MSKNKILEIPIPIDFKQDILEKIIKFIKKPQGFLHIVSLNPENLVIAQDNKEFKKVLCEAKMRIIDGVGIIMASRLLGIKAGERVTGVDLMNELIKIASERRLRVMLIGGKPKLAESLADCYQKKYPEAEFLGIEGIKDIKTGKKSVLKEEERKIFNIVADFKPHLVFVAFGSPYQELWIERHKEEFSGCVVMGVGGAFDFLGGEVKRAPIFIRKIGLEWLFRLLHQPWRWRRQVRLVRFLWLIFCLGFNNLISNISNMFFFSPKIFFEISSEIVVNLISGWIAILLSPLVFDEKYNINQYFPILTRGIILSIIGLIISLWLREKSKKYELGENN